MRNSSPLCPDLSIVILNWNTRDLLRALLSTARNCQPAVSCEWIVVDNASTDGSPAMVAEEFPEIRLIRRETNGGFSVGCNTGLRAASGRYLLLLNSDTEIHPGSLETMVEFLDGHPDVGAVGPKLLNPDGSVQASCRTFPGFHTALFHRKSLLTRLFPGNRYSRAYLMADLDRTEPSEVDWVIGAAMMVRSEVIEQVGLLDEDFFMYAEDVDWCWRMRQKGWRILYLPSATLLHHYEKSAARIPLRTNLARHRSMWRFYHKHYSRGIALLDAATFVGIGLRLLLTSVRIISRLLANRLTHPLRRKPQQ
jgi:GT2 family glycosyltransferase